LRASESAQFLTEATLADVASGFAEEPLRWNDFLEKYPPGTFRIVPKFEVLQASGKKRACDDGHKGGHTSLTAGDNLLELCAATQPATTVKVLHSRAVSKGIILEAAADSLESGGGGDDWPCLSLDTFSARSGATRCCGLLAC
jgi:hypothetical protein